MFDIFDSFGTLNLQGSNWSFGFPADSGTEENRIIKCINDFAHFLRIRQKQIPKYFLLPLHFFFNMRTISSVFAVKFALFKLRLKARFHEMAKYEKNA